MNGSDTPWESAIRAGRLLEGMSFEQRVWAMIARIPRGRVTTYAAIAHAMGTRSYRAVGRAAGRNPWAPDVPCHRVVGSDGRLTGYAFGLDRKAALLAAEGVHVQHQRVAVTDVFDPADPMDAV